jgi:hypothetical protein
MKPAAYNSSPHYVNNLIHQFMNQSSNNNGKNISSSSETSFSLFNHDKINNNVTTSLPSTATNADTKNSHFHYHLYQYQTNHCCFNLLDHSKSSSTVTTNAPNTADNYANSYPLGVTDVSLSLSTPNERAKMSLSDDASNKPNIKPLATSTNTINTMNSLNAETAINTHSSGSEMPSNATVYDNKGTTPMSYDDGGTANTSRLHTASEQNEKIIEIELTNELLKDNDDCSCRHKYLPYKVNERNVWQVYETSDCKYIHSKVEIDEIYQPPPSTTGTAMTSINNTGREKSGMESEKCNLLHSRSNFSNQIICHAINHDVNRNEKQNIKCDFVNTINSQCNSNTINRTSTNDNSLYTPTFNIKPVNLETCQCGNHNNNNNESNGGCENNFKNDNDGGDFASNCDQDDNDDESIITANQQSAAFSNAKTIQMGKLLMNRPKATNNISRDQVKPVEKEIEREITKNGSMKSMKTSKPIRLPSPGPKTQQQQSQGNSMRVSPPKRNNSYEDNSNSSNESSIDTEIESVREKSGKKSIASASKGKSSKDLMKQDGKSVTIPNIHQGRFSLLVFIKFEFLFSLQDGQ